MMVAARRGAVHGLFFAAGFWAGLLALSNYDFYWRVRKP